jgi:hypothetical protein
LINVLQELTSLSSTGKQSKQPTLL